MAINPARAKSLFLAASDLADPAERAAFLDRECGDDADLRDRVEALLAVEDDAPLSPADAMAATNVSEPAATIEYQPLLETGVVIGERYTLREKIGEGGMGEVWVAKQSEPVKRRVALKLIKAGMDSKAVLSRFDQERQALAMMDHPNIAKVYDAGMTATGQPFFVMELVNGLPLDQFCDEATLSIKERLELFVPICQAVQHAHQKGIVHRDLKPANVLVTMIDGKPVPKVIDFGVAKAFGKKMTDETMTQFGAVVGTLAYMSPEQAGFSGDDVDTRADIYSLGVMLYELLTGLRPIDQARLKQAALTEMIRIIREEDPSKPSTRLSTDDALPSLAAIRRTDPKKLTAMLRGELDWVVMKCLEKNRDRRYETANGLVRDIQRYLIDEPVEARPPSTGYRLRKFLKRNKGPTIAAALVLATLLAGITGTTWGFIEARRQQQLALDEAAAKEEARRAEADRANGERLANQQAQKRLKQIEKANEILGFVVAELDPYKLKKGYVPLTTLLAKNLEKAAEQLDSDAIGDPLVVADMQATFARSLLSLGYSAKAIVLFKKSLTTRKSKLGPKHHKTLMNMYFLAKAYMNSSDVKPAGPLLETALKSLSEKFGPAHNTTLQTLSALAEFRMLTNDAKRAISLYEKVIRLQTASLSSTHPLVLVNMNAQGIAFFKSGDYKRAELLFDSALKGSTARLGPDDPRTLACRMNLADVYRLSGDPKRAVGLYLTTLDLLKARLGPEHRDTLLAMGQLAKAYKSLGDLKRAQGLLEKAHKAFTATLGPADPFTLTNMVNLALVYKEANDLKRAVPLLEKAMSFAADKLGPLHKITLNCMKNLNIVYAERGDFKSAFSLITKATESYKLKSGYDDPSLHRMLKVNLDLALQHRRLGRHDVVLPVFEQVYRFRKLSKTTQPKYRIDGENHYGVALFHVKQFERAEPRLLASYRAGLKHKGFPVRWIGIYQDRLANLYAAWGKPAEAKRWRAEAIRFAEERYRRTALKLGPKHPETRTVLALRVYAERKSGRLKQAMPFLAMLSDARPKDTRLIIKLAALQAWFSLDREFAATADRALSIAKNTTNPTTAERMAKVCCLQPSADKARFAAALKLARMAVQRGKTDRHFPYFRMALGMAEYRNENYEAATKVLQVVTTKQKNHPHLGTTSAFYLAMSLYRQRRQTEARHVAVAAAAKMKPLPEDESLTFGKAVNMDDVIVWLAYKEARSLIKFPAPRTKPAVAPRPASLR